MPSSPKPPNSHRGTRPSGPPQGRGRPHARPEKPAADRATPDLAPDGLPNVQLLRRGVERWQAGHPWIYRADLNGDPALGRPGGAGTAM